MTREKTQLIFLLFSHHPNNSDARSRSDWRLLQFKIHERVRVGKTLKKTRGNFMRSQTHRVNSDQARGGRHSTSSMSISQNHLHSPWVLEIYGHVAQAERPAGCLRPGAVVERLVVHIQRSRTTRKGGDGGVILSSADAAGLCFEISGYHVYGAFEFTIFILLLQI